MVKLKKHSHEWLPDGKLKVWVKTEDIGTFTVTVDGNITKEQLNHIITKEYKELKERQKKVMELGIGSEEITVQ